MMQTMAKVLCAAMAAALLGGCGGDVKVVSPPDSGGLIGGGSSFVYPLMNRWAYDYAKSTGTQVNYQSLGSSGGINQFTAGTLDFGGTDAPMNEEQIKAVDGNVLHIPVTMGAVAITYNLPEVKEPLSLTGELIGDIFLGKIKKWNDPAISGLNAGVALPDSDIVTVRRADGSGTTFIFADFVAKKNPEWKQVVGVGNALQWPAGSIGAKGNEGVSAQIKRSPNSIGYVELLYAFEAGLSVASVVNQAGNAVVPSVESVTAAAAELTSVPEDLRLSITDPPGQQAYPISGITWLVTHQTAKNAAQARKLQEFFNYVLSKPAQDIATEMKYSPLPPKLLEPALAKVNQISGKE